MPQHSVPMKENFWPALPLAEWQETYDTLHLWTQIAGKTRLALSPHLNHWWEVPLYVTARGLSTSSIPFQDEIFEIEFDFIRHELRIDCSCAESRRIGLYSRTVADFYAEFMAALRSMGMEVKIWPVPVEVPEPIRFDADRVHATYNPEQAHRFWRVLVTLDSIFKEFRARFIGKDSPVHFFWGSFDMAVTRFSGRPAIVRPDADPITRDAYSHEVISAGFWPGGTDFRGHFSDSAVFYCYAVPEPPGFHESPIMPHEAFYDPQFGEFLLRYDDVRDAESPRETLLAFLQSTYEAAAILGDWDREALERQG